jgi:hypothetical protein
MDAVARACLDATDMDRENNELLLAFADLPRADLARYLTSFDYESSFRTGVNPHQVGDRLSPRHAESNPSALSKSYYRSFDVPHVVTCDAGTTAECSPECPELDRLPLQVMASSSARTQGRPGRRLRRSKNGFRPLARRAASMSAA